VSVVVLCRWVQKGPLWRPSFLFLLKSFLPYHSDQDHPSKYLLVHWDLLVTTTPCNHCRNIFTYLTDHHCHSLQSGLPSQQSIRHHRPSRCSTHQARSPPLLLPGSSRHRETPMAAPPAANPSGEMTTTRPAISPAVPGRPSQNQRSSTMRHRTRGQRHMTSHAERTTIRDTTGDSLDVNFDYLHVDEHFHTQSAWLLGEFWFLEPWSGCWRCI